MLEDFGKEFARDEERRRGEAVDDPGVANFLVGPDLPEGTIVLMRLTQVSHYPP